MCKTGEIEGNERRGRAGKRAHRSQTSVAFRRSMSEMTVDFRRPDVPDNYSDVSSSYNYYQSQQQQQQQPRDRRGSSYYADDDAGSLVRSLSQPSLARSASEFTENNWGLRIRSYEDGDDLSSPDRTPRSSFRDGTADGRERRHEQRHSHHEQRYSSAEYESAAGGTARRTFGGGRTTSAAEWFHDSDDRDDTYRI